MRRESERQLGDELVRGKEHVARKTFRFEWTSFATRIRDWWRGRRPYVRKFDSPNPGRRKA